MYLCNFINHVSQSGIYIVVLIQCLYSSLTINLKSPMSGFNLINKADYSAFVLVILGKFT